jgi:hypothetical protein
MQKEYQNIVEFAKAKKTTRPTVYKAIEDKKLTSERVAGRTLIVVDNLANDWIPMESKKRTRKNT